MNIVRIGNKITAIISPTEIYQKDNLSEEEVSDLFAISMGASPDLDIVRQMMNPEIFKIRRENEQKQATIDAINEGFENSKLVYMLEGSAYMYGINLSMPQILAERIIQAETRAKEQGDIANKDTLDELEGLINFWKRCALNPNPKARQDLFKFITDRDFPITKNGYFLSYRRAWKTDKNKTENPELHDFVLKSYVKIKQQKKSPKNYFVFMSIVSNSYQYMPIKDVSEEYMVSVGSEGNLAELYDKFTTVSDEQVSYTDNHTKTFDIRMGVPVVMERRLGDSNPEIECSAGLHTGSIDYMNRNEWLGDTILALLINPANVVAVPQYDASKMRVCEYMPIGIVETDENGKVIPIDTTFFDHEYSDYSAKQLDEYLHGKELTELSKHIIIAPELTPIELNNIQFDIDRANESIASRVTKTYSSEHDWDEDEGNYDWGFGEDDIEDNFLDLDNSDY